MSFTRLRSFTDLAPLGILFAITLTVGCQGDRGPSSESPSNNGPVASQAQEPDTEVVEAAPSPSVGEGDSASEADTSASVGNQSDSPPVMVDSPPIAGTTEEPSQPATPESAMPAQPNVAESSPAQPTVPAASVDVPDMAPRPAVPPRSEPRPPSPFSENPLREGTDDFPANPPMAASITTSNNPATVEPSQPASKVIVKPVTNTSTKRLGKGKDGDFDPIAENGPIFVGWKKPKVALLISGRQDGYLEPCGCAGLEKMKGGLTRRHSLFKKLRADGWPVVAVDCGGLVKGFGRQAELKFHLSVDAMQEMGYNAIALGKSDLRLPGGELLSRVASSEGAPSPFLSANVAVFGFDTEMTQTHKIVEAGGLRIGITSVLGIAWQKQINNSDIEMADPEAKLRELMPKLKDHCDLLVLLAHATMDESKALATAFPEFDIVVTAGGDPLPPEDMEVLPGGTKLIEVGEKGMEAIVLGIYNDGQIKYQRVPLDSRFPDSPDMIAFMRQYQEQLKRDGLAELGIRPVPHPRAQELGKFVGSKKCDECHETSYDVWKKSGHAKAWETLVNLRVPRNFDPECISCHVVGWHPTEYFPYESGFMSEGETPELINVGCESCHGPGEKHVEAEMGSDAELQKKLQQALVVTKEQAQRDKTRWCLNCHDLDNSPDFNFEEYWPKIEHSEDVWEDEK